MKFENVLSKDWFEDLNNTENMETAVMSKLLIACSYLTNIKRCLTLKEMVMNAVRKAFSRKRRMGGIT